MKRSKDLIDDLDKKFSAVGSRNDLINECIQFAIAHMEDDTDT